MVCAAIQSGVNINITLPDWVKTCSFTHVVLFQGYTCTVFLEREVHAYLNTLAAHVCGKQFTQLQYSCGQTWIAFQYK